MEVSEPCLMWSPQHFILHVYPQNINDIILVSVFLLNAKLCVRMAMLSLVLETPACNVTPDHLERSHTRHA